MKIAALFVPSLYGNLDDCYARQLINIIGKSAGVELPQMYITCGVYRKTEDGYVMLATAAEGSPSDATRLWTATSTICRDDRDLFVRPGEFESEEDSLPYKAGRFMETVMDGSVTILPHFGAVLAEIPARSVKKEWVPRPKGRKKMRWHLLWLMSEQGRQKAK